MGDPSQEERELRAEITACARRLYDRGLITAQDGNLSARLSDGEILITPSGADKAALTPDQLLRIDIVGRVREGAGRPSMEIELHLAAYQERPWVRAAVHAHPPTALALSLAGVSFEPPALPEALVSLGAIATVPYATPGSAELAERARPLLRDHDVAVLSLHGAITLGRTILEAYSRMERLEFVARVLRDARALGPIPPLPAEEVQRLLALRRQMLGY